MGPNDELRGIRTKRPGVALLTLALAVATLLQTSAAHASGVDPTRISLPKGPASIEGLGGSFTPSAATGTASYGVDIALPPVAMSPVPGLRLEYDAGGGVSELGIGWRLGGLPRIRLSTRDGLPRFDGTDRFELVGFGGVSELVELEPGLFRAEHESGAFVRVRRSSDGTSWEARDKSGLLHRFGEAGFIETENARTATWLLREQVDLHGHVTRYAWDVRDGYALLQSITLNDYGPDTRVSVSFAYEARPDQHLLFSAGIKQRIASRLAHIEVKLGDSLVRGYRLAYGESNRHSQLSEVTVVGTDGVTALPPVRLGYTQAELDGGGELVTMSSAPGWTPADSNIDLSDLDGDTLPDLLVTEPGSYRAYLNHDGSSWRAPQSFVESPTVALSATGATLADVDGDGAADLLVKSGTSDFRYLPGLDATRFAPAVRIPTVPNFAFDDPDVRLADMDGDRRVDVIVTTSAGIAIAYNVGGRDWTEPAMIELADSQTWAPALTRPVDPVDHTRVVRFSDGRTSLCDMNGDRVQDLCILRPGALVYYLGRGRGYFEPAATATGVPDFDPAKPWRILDLDNDGWTDLVDVGVTQISYVLADGIGRFGEVRRIAGVPEQGPYTHVTFADMNGSGSTDVVWVDLSARATAAWRYLELFPDGRAGLLAHIDNGLGKVTRITYEPAALDAARARESGEAWSARMNVAMSVVRRVEIDSSLADPVLVTDYSYRDGTWDPAERTFAGFASSLERAVGDEHTPTLVSETHYDTGLATRTLRGMPRFSEQRDELGRVFQRTHNDYEARVLDNGVDGRTVEHAYRKRERVEHIEATSVDPAAIRTVVTDWDQDEYGNVVSERRYGDEARSGDEAFTRRTFANDPVDWLLGRLATQELTDASGTRFAMRRSYYDGVPFVGLPLGQATRGDLVREEAWVGPGPDDFELVASTRYDADGHPVETRDARGGGRVFAWDPQDHTTLLSEQVKLPDAALIEHVEIDRRFGLPTAVTHYNGQKAHFEYDALGRIIKVVQPGDSADLPTVTYEYQLDAPLSRVVTLSRIASGQSSVDRSEDLVDGLGRKRASLVRNHRVGTDGASAANGSAPPTDGVRAANRAQAQWVLAGVALLDARGTSYRELRPRFVDAAEHDAPDLFRAHAPGTTTWRDALGRTVRAVSTGGVETRTEHGPLTTRTWDGGRTSAALPYGALPDIEEHDGLGRVVSATRHLDGAPLTASFTYDPGGLLLERKDPEGHVARYRYDGRGRRATVDDPDLGTHELVHDATDNLIERRRPDGSVLRYGYDLAGRLLTEDWDGDGSPEIRRYWDRHPAAASSDPLQLGKLVRVEDASGSAEHTYDARGRITETRLTIGDKTYRAGSDFDAQDREVLHTYADGSSLRIHYSPRGQISGYGDAIRFAYDADGLEFERRFNTGVVQLTGHDEERRPREIRITASDGSLIEHLSRKFDGAGNVVGIQDLRPGVAKERDRTETYAYDSLYRLRSARGEWGSTEWDYTPSGTLQSRRSTLANQHAEQIERGDGVDAGPHAITKIGSRRIGYDALGRMTEDGERTYHFNAADQLTRVERRNGAAVENVFDADGIRRIRSERDSSGTTHTTHFISAWSEVRDGKLVRYIVHGGQRIARLASDNGVATGAAAGAKEPGAFAALLHAKSGSFADALRWGRLPVLLALLALLALLGVGSWRAAPRTLRIRTLLAAATVLTLTGCGGDDVRDQSSRSPDGGTVVVLREADTLLVNDPLGTLLAETTGSGKAKAHFAAYPFGATRYDTSGETNAYVGTPRDRGVGLDVMGARAYAPDLGIWTIGDPILINSPERTIGSAFSHANPYAYAALTPLIAVDTDGNMPWVAILGGAFAGGASSAAIEAVRQLLHNGKIDQPGRIAAAAAGGAVSGALSAGLGPIVNSPIGKAVIGGASEVVGGMLTRFIDSGGKSVGTFKDAAEDFVKGSVSKLRGAARGGKADGSTAPTKKPGAPKAAAPKTATKPSVDDAKPPPHSTTRNETGTVKDSEHPGSSSLQDPPRTPSVQSDHVSDDAIPPAMSRWEAEAVCRSGGCTTP